MIDPEYMTPEWDIFHDLMVVECCRLWPAARTNLGGRCGKCLQRPQIVPNMLWARNIETGEMRAIES